MPAAVPSEWGWESLTRKRKSPRGFHRKGSGLRGTNVSAAKVGCEWPLSGTHCVSECTGLRRAWEWGACAAVPALPPDPLRELRQECVLGGGETGDAFGMGSWGSRDPPATAWAPGESQLPERGLPAPWPGRRLGSPQRSNRTWPHSVQLWNLPGHGLPGIVALVASSTVPCLLLKLCRKLPSSVTAGWRAWKCGVTLSRFSWNICQGPGKALTSHRAGPPSQNRQHQSQAVDGWMGRGWVHGCLGLENRDQELSFSREHGDQSQHWLSLYYGLGHSPNVLSASLDLTERKVSLSE
uniref:uncharacterized protein LOC118533609 isoform X2 n=1 Tax=Halichoerus grypus TaxID=9711 RepID=UPI001659A4F5|nr:uncharacterized protein LOC118533609 isoform X2 [Halichoerus grypus]